MGLDIDVRIRKKEHCKRCGCPHAGEIIEQIDAGGRTYYDLLEKIGYGDESYGQFVELDDSQVRTLAMFAASKEQELYGGHELAKATALALVTGDIVEFEADW